MAKMIIEIKEHDYKIVCNYMDGKGYSLIPPMVTHRIFEAVTKGTLLKEQEDGKVD